MNAEAKEAARELAQIFAETINGSVDAAIVRLDEHSRKIVEEIREAAYTTRNAPPAEAPEDRDLREAVEQWIRARVDDPLSTYETLASALASIARRYALAELAKLEATE